MGLPYSTSFEFGLELSATQSVGDKDPEVICVSDLGTNSFHSVIVRICDGEIEVIDRLKQTVALGTEGFSNGVLSESALSRAIQAMVEVYIFGFRRQASGHLAIATSAIREASNGPELIQGIKRRTGITVTPISGLDEAFLIYKGVTGTLHISEPSLLVDIGGGSTEISIATSTEIYASSSYPLGAARLSEQFVRHDPVSVQEIQSLNSHFEKLLRPMLDKGRSMNVRTLVGSSGTLENMAIMASTMTLDMLVDKEFSLPASNIEAVARELQFSNREYRENIPRLSSKRVDQIVAGATLVSFLLNQSGIEQVRISPSSLREGVLLEYVTQQNSLARGLGRS